MQQSTALQIDGPGIALAGPAGSEGLGRAGMPQAAMLAGLLVYAAAAGGAWWAIGRLVPDHLTVSLLGHSHDFKALHQRFDGAVLLLLLLLPAALWLECAVVGWARSSVRRLLFDRTASMKTDLACLVLGQVHVLDILGRLMTLGASMLSGMWIRNWLSATFGLAIDPAALPVALQVVAYFYVYSFFDYWAHRVDHSRYFWPLHRWHHAADEFHVVTAVRAHPAAFTGIFFISLPMAVLGASPEVMIFVSVLTTALGFLIHSRIDSDFGWIGRWIIQSPNHHRLHHILDISEGVGHFGMAPIWDHLFGTWRGDADQTLVIGVDTPYRHGLWVAPDLLRDYRDFWAGFVQRRRAGG